MDRPSGEVAPFTLILDVFSFWLARTFEEAATIVSMSDLSFVQNLLEGENMELIPEITHSMFKVVSLFSLVSASIGDTLALGNPTKERDTWKEKCEDMKLRLYTLQVEPIAMQEKDKARGCPQRGIKINDSPSTMVARVTKLEDALKEAEK